MLVINLCSTSIGFLHQVFSVGGRCSLGLSVNQLCRGSVALPSNATLREAVHYCDGLALPPFSVGEASGVDAPADALPADALLPMLPLAWMLAAALLRVRCAVLPKL